MVKSGLVPRGAVVRTVGAAVALGLCLTTGGLHAEEEANADQPTLGRALKKGRFDVLLHYRFEEVSDDAPAVQAKDAHASTLRSTLTYTSARYRGFSLRVEFEDVTDIGLEDQHDNAGAGGLSNGVSDRPVIADPDVTELNQAYLRFEGLPETSLLAGREEIALANQRFIGPVGWRQNHQTLDVLRVDQGSIPHTKLTYVFVANVNRVFGDNRDISGHLLHATVDVAGFGQLTPYVYHLDFDDPAAALSTRTYGASWAGRLKPGGDWTLPYRVELAQQSDVADNPQRVDAGYRLLEIGAAHERVWFRVGYELLEGAAADGQFSTPLATLHKFNGWADKFLSTPTDGLEDIYLALGGAVGRLNWTLAYHDFGADSSSTSYGSEVDAEVAIETPWQQRFALKAALYDADDFAADTEKLWFSTSYRF